MHDEPRQEKHNEALTATGRSEIGTAFAVSERFLMCQDVCQQLPRSEILRIAGNDFHVLAIIRIREIDEIVDDIIQAFFPEHSLYHCVEGINAVCRAVVHLDTAPRVEELIIGKNGSGFRIYTIRDNRKAVVLEQLRDVPKIPCRYLDVCVMNSCVFLDGGLELHDNNRHTVQIHDGIRTACRIRSLHGHLVDDADDVLVVHTVEVNQTQMEVLRTAVFTHECLALNHTKEHSLICAVNGHR